MSLKTFLTEVEKTTDVHDVLERALVNHKKVTIFLEIGLPYNALGETEIEGNLVQVTHTAFKVEVLKMHMYAKGKHIEAKAETSDNKINFELSKVALVDVTGPIIKLKEKKA